MAKEGTVSENSVGATDEFESLVQLFFHKFPVLEVFLGLIAKQLFLFLRICSIGQTLVMGPTASIDLQLKFSPFGPAYFWANPAVIHVDDLMNVLSLFTSVSCAISVSRK